jgi:ribosomal protein S15P/S13E
LWFAETREDLCITHTHDIRILKVLSQLALHAGVAGSSSGSLQCSLLVPVADGVEEHLQKHMSDFVREKRHLLAEFTVTGLLVEVMKAVV